MSQEMRYNPAVDYYRILGVPSSASLDVIRRAFRQKAKESHPDHNPTRKAWAHQQFQQINMAYSVLSDPDLRAEYDRQRLFYLQQAFETPTAQAAARTERTSTKRPIPWWWVVAGAIGVILGIALNTVKPPLSIRPTFSSPPVFDIPNNSPTVVGATYRQRACTDPNVQIHAPTDGQVISGVFYPRITAMGAYPMEYLLQLGTFRSSSDNQIRWEGLAAEERSVQQKTLFNDGHPNPLYGLNAGKYVLRLIVHRAQEERICDVVFFISH